MIRPRELGRGVGQHPGSVRDKYTSTRSGINVYVVVPDGEVRENFGPVGGI